jgi:hypothetical protein
MSLSQPAATATSLRRTLATCVPELQRHCADPWVVIGSAAAWLAGAEVTVADVDVLTSVRDARSLVSHWQTRLLTTEASKDGDRFRSHFARFDFPVAVEIMGGLELASPDGWTAVRVKATLTLAVDGVEVPVPTLAEQVLLLQSFGRPKDRERVERLKRLDGYPA